MAPHLTEQQIVELVTKSVHSVLNSITPKATEKQIEDILTEEIYELMSRQVFYDFYMSQAKDSFTAHIECRDNCPSKKEILTKIRVLFNPVIRKAKDLI